MSIRLLVQNGYPDYPQITKQIQAIQVSCPKLFDIVLPRSEQSGNTDLEARALICPPGYSNIAVGKRLSQEYCREFLNLPIRISKVEVFLRNKISNAYSRDYKNSVTLIDSRPIKW